MPRLRFIVAVALLAVIASSSVTFAGANGVAARGSTDRDALNVMMNRATLAVGDRLLNDGVPTFFARTPTGYVAIFDVLPDAVPTAGVVQDPFLVITASRDGRIMDVDLYTVLGGNLGNRTLLQRDLLTGQASVLQYKGHVVTEEKRTVTPQVTEPTCYICTETETVPGHEDDACLTAALAGCAILDGDVYLRAACVAAAYAACYVPAYTYCVHWEVSHICPTP